MSKMVNLEVGKLYRSTTGDLWKFDKPKLASTLKSGLLRTSVYLTDTDGKKLRKVITLEPQPVLTDEERHEKVAKGILSSIDYYLKVRDYVANQPGGDYAMSTAILNLVIEKLDDLSAQYRKHMGYRRWSFAEYQFDHTLVGEQI